MQDTSYKFVFIVSNCIKELKTNKANERQLKLRNAFRWTDQQSRRLKDCWELIPIRFSRSASVCQAESRTFRLMTMQQLKAFKGGIASKPNINYILVLFFTFKSERLHWLLLWRVLRLGAAKRRIVDQVEPALRNVWDVLVVKMSLIAKNQITLLVSKLLWLVN
ncbi:hypothetical protein M5K25_002085 [Dendrobium thyrsiflorum]|uniref:Uncharacterized protein n=1 Tax=Dendrobium thyrsiflorum TaxID=117978 RepID=A0ABD0W2Z8_DENTH